MWSRRVRLAMGLLLHATAGEQEQLLTLAGALQQRHAALRLQVVHLGADRVLLEDPAQRIGVLIMRIQE